MFTPNSKSTYETYKSLSTSVYTHAYTTYLLDTDARTYMHAHTTNECGMEQRQYAAVQINP